MGRFPTRKTLDRSRAIDSGTLEQRHCKPFVDRWIGAYAKKHGQMPPLFLGLQSATEPFKPRSRSSKVHIHIPDVRHAVLPKPIIQR